MLKIGSKIDEIRIDGDLDKLRKDLEHYADLALDAVEIPVHGVDIIKDGIPDKKRLKEVQSILSSFDFIYTVHGPNPLNLMEVWNPSLHIEVFKASLEFSVAIGSNILVYHAGRFIPEETFPLQNGKGVSKQVALRLMEIEKEHLDRLSGEYPTVTICVENARPYLFHSPYCYGERIDFLKEQILDINRENVRIALDIGHLYMAAHYYEFDPVQAVEEIKDLIAHTHVHDNFGGAINYHEKIQTHQIPFGRGDAHMPVGWGKIPIAEILNAYLSIYPGMLIMELRNRYFLHTQESQENLKGILNSIPTRSEEKVHESFGIGDLA